MNLANKRIAENLQKVNSQLDERHWENKDGTKNE